MNVSVEADKEFMRLLRIEDPQRYANLIRNMEQAAARQQRSQEQDTEKLGRPPKNGFTMTGADRMRELRLRKAS
jgi:hypothetical protein